MNRREFAIAALSSVAIVAGCDTDQKPAHTATLLNNSDVQQAVQRLASAISGLQSAVSDFGSEDWKDVVPAVQTASEDVDGAFQGLRSALGVAGT